MAGPESLPEEIDELGSERCKSYQVFLCWKAKLCVRLDAGMRRELRKLQGGCSVEREREMKAAGTWSRG